MTKYYHSFTFPNGYFSNNIFNTFRLTLFSAILIFAVSCEEDPTIIGKKILPASDFATVISTDTISVRSYTMYTDSVASSNPSYSYLGQIYDPYFGTTTAGFVTQLRLSESGVDKIFAVIDSVKLFLTLANVQGNVEAGHILKLSEIAEQIYTTSTYYSNKSVQLTGYSIDVEMPELQADTINDIVLDLPVEFGDSLTRDPSMLMYDTTKKDFRSFFKGLDFRLTSAGDPVFLTLSLSPTGVYNNYFAVYYHDEVDKPKELYFILDAMARNACFNTYSHDFNTAEPGKKIQHINDSFRDTLTYLQCFNGVFVKMALPSLGNIKNDPLFTGIAVNKARIICPAWYDGSLYKPSTFPSQIYLRYIDETGAKRLVHDLDIYNQTYGNYPFFDGTIDTTAGVYNLNIASFVQNYLEDTGNKIKPEVEIFLPSGSTKNAILKANRNSNPAKFEFTYTRF
jgi:hypothetical protein